jgi:hypothetical protein
MFLVTIAENRLISLAAKHSTPAITSCSKNGIK